MKEEAFLFVCINQNIADLIYININQYEQNQPRFQPTHTGTPLPFSMLLPTTQMLLLLTQQTQQHQRLYLSVYPSSSTHCTPHSPSCHAKK
jgi:hypothetical protein